MQSLTMFNHVTLDGYFCDARGSMEWAKQDDDPELAEFASAKSRGGGTLVFGRRTYEMMKSFWPTPQAARAFPRVAERMNQGAKVVFSRALEKADWANTRLIRGDLVEETRALKQEEGQGLAILGSGRIVAQLSLAGLIDEYQLVVNPVVLGAGRTLFEGAPGRQNLNLVESRVFKSGKVYLCYRPA